MEYSAGMVSCLFWFNETRKTAELLMAGKSRDEIKELALKENIYQARSEDRKRRIFGVAMKRLDSLPRDVIAAIAGWDAGAAKLLVLISIMKTDLMFFEFMYEVFRQAVMLGEKELSSRAIDAFFDEKRAQSQEVAGWSQVAIEKLKQTYAKILAEAGLLSISKNKKEIITPPIDHRLRELADKNGLKPYLDVITGEI
ncbi:MAG: hypothetical protein PWP48_824 [Clostridiales bacterium]|nr:hypothetical protein [Clostridiales bacterium]